MTLTLVCLREYYALSVVHSSLRHLLTRSYTQETFQVNSIDLMLELLSQRLIEDYEQSSVHTKMSLEQFLDCSLKYFSRNVRHRVHDLIDERQSKLDAYCDELVSNTLAQSDELVTLTLVLDDETADYLFTR